MVCVGSVAGAVAWAVNIPSNDLIYEANSLAITRRQSYTLAAASFRSTFVFLILYGLEFFCLIISKLMLLGRLAASAVDSSQVNVAGMSGVRRRWLSGRTLPIVYRVMAGAVVVGSVVGLVASCVAGVYYAQQANLNDEVAGACDAAGNDTNSSLFLLNAVIDLHTKAYTARSVEASSEALTLLLVTIAFVVIVSWSLAIFRIAESVAANAMLSMADRSQNAPSELNVAIFVGDTMKAAADNRRRLTFACVIVLVTFPARAAFDLLNAYSTFQDPYNPACGVCDPCQLDRYLIRQWLNYTPEFQSIVVAVSSPLPLTLSLWLITKAHARAQLISTNAHHQAAVGNRV